MDNVKKVAFQSFIFFSLLATPLSFLSAESGIVEQNPENNQVAHGGHGGGYHGGRGYNGGRRYHGYRGYGGRGYYGDNVRYYRGYGSYGWDGIDYANPYFDVQTYPYYYDDNNGYIYYYNQ